MGRGEQRVRTTKKDKTFSSSTVNCAGAAGKCFVRILLAGTAK